MKKTFLFALIVLLLGACTPKCDIDGYNTSVSPILSEWSDAHTLASQTPRVSLPAQIQALQTIKREAEQLVVPGCLVDAHSHLISSMNHSINGFIAFMGQESDKDVNYYFTNAEYELNQYHDALDTLSSGK